MQHPHFEKKQKITEPPSSTSSEDIVLGSVNLKTLQQTVGRLHVHVDEKPILISNDNNEHNILPAGSIGKEGETISSLPDLIQQQSRMDSNSSSSVSGSMHPLPSIAGTVMSGIDSMSPQLRSRSGSNASQQSTNSVVGSGSSRTSPQHVPGSSLISLTFSTTSAGGVPQNLTDLQDPTKFTLGKAEQKKRITKSSFERKGSVTGLDTNLDPADPLTSLDPLWTINKLQQSEK